METPERIWLTADLYPSSGPRAYRTIKLDDTDVEYTRADLATPPQEWMERAAEKIAAEVPQSAIKAAEDLCKGGFIQEWMIEQAAKVIAAALNETRPAPIVSSES